MNHPAAAPFELHVARAVEATPSSVPLVVGGCCSGRTALLMRLRERFGSRRCQYIDTERIATTPERFHRAILACSPFSLNGHLPAEPRSPRAAFEATVHFLQAAHTSEGQPAVFLLDEVLELRTFESFPGLRLIIPDLLGAITDTPNRFVLSTRFATRARRLAQAAAGRVELHVIPALDLTGTKGVLDEAFAGARVGPDDETAQAVQALSAGQLGYAHLLAVQMRAMAEHGPADPLSALVALLSPGGRLSTTCRFTYELRLHRARGYGALKAILEVLAEEEPLTLTGVAQRLGRTPGSTKDYLSWLEDVDLVDVTRKRYRFADPLLRAWVRLQARPEPPTEEQVAREVHRYAADRLSSPSPAPLATPAEARHGDIIEFD